MISLIKGLPFGLLLSWLVSTFIGTEGSTGGMLNIQHIPVHGTVVLFSGTLFVIGSALAWALIKMME